MTRVSVRRRVAATIAIALVTVAVGCSDGGKVPTVAEVPTTTNPALAADLEPTPAPLAAAAIVSGLESAVTSGDLCAVLAAIDVAEPGDDDRDGATEVYRALAAAVKASRPFVPADLRTSWEDIVVGTDEAATAVEDHDGDVADPEVEAALGSTAMVEALESVERYQITQCPAPKPTA